MAATTEFESMWAGADETWGERGPVYSRKEKSLGELARRFLFLCGRLHNAEINLQQCAQDLDVERRRIYDIINILEAFNVVQRLGKNTYLWRGIQELIFFVANLDFKSRRLSEPADLLDALENSEATWQALFECDERRARQELQLAMGHERRAHGHTKKKSLCFLSERFVKLFYSWKQTIALEEAASLFMNDVYILPQHLPASQLAAEDYQNLRKTKVRRLYDIANILQALRLITKTVDASSRPAFRWIGLPGLLSFCQELFGALAQLDPIEEEDCDAETRSDTKICISLDTQSLLQPRKAPQTMPEHVVEQILRLNALNSKVIGLKPVFAVTSLKEPLLSEVRVLMKQNQFKEASRLLKVWGHCSTKRSYTIEPPVLKKPLTVERGYSSSSIQTCSSPSERTPTAPPPLARPVPQVGSGVSIGVGRGWGKEVKFSLNSAFVTPDQKASPSTEAALSSEKVQVWLTVRAFANLARSGVKTLNFDEPVLDDTK